MGDNFIGIDYDGLKNAAVLFGREADRIRQVTQLLGSRAETLKKGWVGRGADVFQKEMQSSILPAFKRLSQALQEANGGINRVNQIFQSGEQEAAGYINQANGASHNNGGDTAGGGGNPGGTGDTGGGGTPKQNVVDTSTKDTSPSNVHLTPAELMKAMPGLSKEKAETMAPALNKAMDEFGINTPEKRNMFLAQIGHESNDLNSMRENLNYSKDALIKTWPKRFNEDNAGDYARQPEKIANHAYANRMGNGDEASGDGWKYRGRGAIQLTGKTNYESAGKALGLDLVNHPELLEQPENAMRASAWWWQNHGLNEMVDKNPTDVTGVTKVINGGTNGLQDRIDRFNRISGNK